MMQKPSTVACVMVVGFIIAAPFSPWLGCSAWAATLVIDRSVTWFVW